ncbi:hypothetical protein, partial [Acidithiobacillus concretivorus]|uniref:hypothetical protein n=1 Tax=Acidithiobacillus concretivorus TaxID=3063952 RepID=UPI001C0745BC
FKESAEVVNPREMLQTTDNGFLIHGVLFESVTLKRRVAYRLFAPMSLACCSKAHPAVRRELALRAQTALLTGAGFHQEQQRRGTKSRQSL